MPSTDEPASRRSTRWLAALVGAALSAGTVAVTEPSAAETRRTHDLRTLQPGAEVTVDSPIRVNIVMVGYEPGSFDVDRVLAGLPATSRPTVFTQGVRGVHDEVGLEHRYEYVPRFAGRSFDDAFFRHLTSTGTTAPAGPQAQWYNDQASNVLDVPSELLYIDASSTEQWLEQQAHRRLGIGRDDYTVFLVNWWGRPDFRFHAYQATGDPDPDTGIDLGHEWYAQLISWGGATGRSWFLDLSAGPDYWQFGFEVDTADLTGDGMTDHRLPPVWEYGNTGYRPFDDLEGDLALAVRHVAIEGLFTASPWFDPTHYVPAPGGARVLDIASFQGDPSQTGIIQPEVVSGSFQALAPYYGTELRVTEHPYTDEVRRALQIAGGSLDEDDCWNQFGRRVAQVHCWFGERADQYWPEPSPGDAVVRGLNFTLTDEDSFAFGYFGLALSNDVDGTPTVFSTNVGPSYLPAWGGHTHRTLHSAGHMIGLGHGIEGYDSEQQTYLQPYGGRLYLLLGDAVQSPMSYLFNHTRFGRFNVDNLDRWMVAGLLNRANADTGAILQSPSGGTREVQGLLRQADRTFGRSLEAFGRGRWDQAAALAAQAYDDVQRAAALGDAGGGQRSGAGLADAPTSSEVERLASGGATAPARRPCAVPVGADLEASALPPGCANADVAPAASVAPSLFCPLMPS